MDRNSGNFPDAQNSTSACSPEHLVTCLHLADDPLPTGQSQLAAGFDQ